MIIYEFKQQTSILIYMRCNWCTMRSEPELRQQGPPGAVRSDRLESTVVSIHEVQAGALLVQRECGDAAHAAPDQRLRAPPRRPQPVHPGGRAPVRPVNVSNR